jgi:hypothetical protein
MNIDLVQVLTNLVVGAVSAWIAGKFGVRRGLEQSRTQRAFERRLEWYEQTFRAFNRFNTNLRKLWQARSQGERERLMSVGAEHLKQTEEVRACVDGATVYAEKKTLVRMRELFIKLEATRDLASGPKIEDADLARKIAATIEIADEIMYELAGSIRGQLHLDKIEVKDLSWGKLS